METTVHLPVILCNRPAHMLADLAVDNGEAVRTQEGAIAIDTRPYTGRSPHDKFMVVDEATEDTVAWGNDTGRMSRRDFAELKKRLESHMLSHRHIYAEHRAIGANRRYAQNVNLYTTSPTSALFGKYMLLPAYEGNSKKITVYHDPTFKAVPERDNTRSEVFVAINATTQEIIIGGSSYLGEIKKSVFGTYNFLIRREGVLPMHASAVIDKHGNPAIIFGLSGTGKTTLANMPDALMVGDDEHGWASDGTVYNFEFGNYAKVKNLSRENEPEIWAAVHSLGTILENVHVDEHGIVHLESDRTEANARASYPLAILNNVAKPTMCGVPKAIFFLAADAYGVLPAISVLSPNEAAFYFANGYTSKVAGTERGVTEPVPTFSPCFGGPFMPEPVGVYTNMLAEKISEFNVPVYLINTGWDGTGARQSLQYTRRVIEAALAGEIDTAELGRTRVLGLHFPALLEGVPRRYLNPRATWTDGSAYHTAAKKLRNAFQENALKISSS